MRSIVGVAASIAIVVAFAWFFVASSGGPAWADVAARLATVRNVGFWMQPHSVGADGHADHLPWFREYHQDPGLMRREYYGVSDGRESPTPPQQKEPVPLESYQICRIEGDRQQWYDVNVPSKFRHVEHHVTIGYSHDRTYQAQDWWNRLQEISSDAARKVDVQVLGDKPCTVFEADVDKLWGYPSQKGAVTKLRIWVDKGPSLPVRVQFTGRYPDGTTVEQTMEDMRWDQNLPAEFFVPPTGYPTLELGTSIYLPEGTRLKDGVRARLYAENGFEIFNETQVERVTSMAASAQGIVGRVNIRPSQEFCDRWQQIWPKIGDGKLLYDFNGELTADYGTWHTHSFPVGFDLSGLGLTAEQFQSKYLEMPK
jgi:outer membrane lipoprotein-sorting protein